MLFSGHGSDPADPEALDPRPHELGRRGRIALAMLSTGLVSWMASAGFGRFETTEQTLAAMLRALLWLIVPLLAVALIAFIAITLLNAVRGEPERASSSAAASRASEDSTLPTESELRRHRSQHAPRRRQLPLPAAGGPFVRVQPPRLAKSNPNDA